jgi:hypothetical protein
MGFPVLVTPVEPSGEQNAPGVTYTGSLGGGAGASVGCGAGWCVTGGGGAGACVVVVGGSVVVVVDSVVVVGVVLLGVVVLADVTLVLLVVATMGSGAPGCCAGTFEPNKPERTRSTVKPPPSDVSRRDHTGVRHHQRASAEGAGSAGTLMRDQYEALCQPLGWLCRVHSNGW